MKYQVEYTRSAVNSLKKLDKQTAAFILTYIEKRLVDCDDPRRYGKALAGGLSDKWRYRAGHLLTNGSQGIVSGLSVYG